MCSIPHEEILPQNVFTMPSFFSLSNVALLFCLVALSSLIYQDFCPFYTNQYPPKGFDWHM